jgi:hypothetical protein
MNKPTSGQVARAIYLSLNPAVGFALMWMGDGLNSALLTAICVAALVWLIFQACKP